MKEGLWKVRLYDGFDNEWMDICDPCSYTEAKALYDDRTCNGTVKTSYSDIDYYKLVEVKIL